MRSDIYRRSKLSFPKTFAAKSNQKCKLETSFVTPISRWQSKRIQTLALGNADNKPKFGPDASQLLKSSSYLYQNANLFRSGLDVARLSLF